MKSTFEHWNEKKTYGLIALIILFRALFSWKIPLIDDEAYHWSWTKDLMLSYFDHPAMIAWLESLSTQYFGLSYWTVRLPSTILYSATMIMLYKLAKEIFDASIGALTIVILTSSPLWGFGGFVASPETPFMFFFITACYVFWCGYGRSEKAWGAPKTWIWLGIVMGLGLNSKFIITLLAPGFGLYLLSSPKGRADLQSKWPWIGFLIATLLCLPVFLWNIQYDWPSFRYQFYERHTGTGFSLNRWLQWFTAQILFYTPIVYFLILNSLFHSFKNLNDNRWKFIGLLSFPTLIVFYLQPLWADYKPHWPGGAHLILVIGACALWYQGTEWFRAKSKIILRLGLGFLIPLNILIYSPFAGSWIPFFYEKFKTDNMPQWNPSWDLSNEFYGWEELGQELNRMQREFHSDVGLKPFLAALRYETTAQTWWGSQQKIYGLFNSRSHYTIMQNARKELEQLIGQNALIVTTDKYPENPTDFVYFDRCEKNEFRTVRHFFSNEFPSRTFFIWKCFNFKGIKK